MYAQFYCIGQSPICFKLKPEAREILENGMFLLHKWESNIEALEREGMSSPHIFRVFLVKGQRRELTDSYLNYKKCRYCEV